MSPVPSITSAEVNGIVEHVTFELAAFAQKVRELESRCQEFRAGVEGLSQGLHASCDTLAREETPADGETSPRRLAERAGMAPRIEDSCLKLSGRPAVPVMLIREPGGVIPVCCALGSELCDAALGKSKGEDTRAAVDALAAEIRGIFAALSDPGCRQSFGKSVRCIVLYVPHEVQRSVLFDLLPGIRQEAQEHHVVLAPPSALFSILKCAAGAWIRLSCSGSIRSLVDKGQDLVDDLSAFISFFTDNEKALCDAVETYARESRATDAGGALP